MIAVSILNRSKMQIVTSKRIMIIEGEATLTPAFYADVKSMIHWEPPYEKEEITEGERTKIIKMVEEYTKDKDLKVYFD